MDKEQRDGYREQAAAKYGQQLVLDSEVRIAALGENGIRDLQKQWFDICTMIYERRDYGACDKLVQQQAAALHAWVNQFWDCDTKAFRSLGATYNENADFNANISRQFGSELPAFLQIVIESYCDAQNT